MQKEVISLETGLDFILGHTLRHRGSCVLKRGFNYVSGTYPLTTNTVGLNPVKKLAQGIILDNTLIEEPPATKVTDWDHYLPCHTNKIFKYPAYPTIALSTLTRVDADTFSLSGTGFNDPLFSVRHIHYQTDYETLFGYDSTGTHLKMLIKLPPSLPTFKVGELLAMEVDISVKSTKPDHYLYFKITAKEEVAGGVALTVIPVTEVGITTTFAWIDLLGVEAAPVTGVSIEIKTYPYIYISPIINSDIVIETVPTGKDHLLGTWTLTYRDNKHYIYKVGGTASTDTTFAGVTATVPVDAVEYDLSAVIINYGTISRPSLVFIDENRVESRSMMPSTVRRFSNYNLTWQPVAGSGAAQYVMPGKTFAADSGHWIAKDADMYMLCPPVHMPFVKLWSKNFDYYNINLGFGRRYDISPAVHDQYTKTLRRASLISQSAGAGIMTMSKGQACPPGWKEVMGEVGDDSEDANSLELSTTLKVPESTFKSAEQFSDDGEKVYVIGSSIAYDENTNTTTIALDPKNGLSNTFFKDGFYDWSVQYKNQPVKMLNRPDPSTAELTVRWGLFKFRIPVPFAPKLPARKQRYLKIPYGDRVMKWPPGVQALFIGDPDIDIAPTRLLENKATVVGFVTGMKVRANYASRETPSSDTYPSKYPTSIFRQLALGIGAWGGGYGIYNWVDKLLGRERLPAVTTDIIGGVTVELSIYGNFKDKLTNLMSGSGDQFIIFSKTGYLRAASNQAGVTGFGSPQHNHTIKELGDQQLQSLDYQIKSTWDSHLEHCPPVAKNHGHGWLGEGSYNRPKATAVKLCVKL